MYTRRLIRAGLAALVIAQCGFATSGQSAEPPKPDVDPAVTLSPVALPIIVDGRLANYIFVTVKIKLTRSADEAALRDKEPYFRDALVRAAHRTPFVLHYDYNHVDAGRLRAVMLREAGAISGPNTIRDIVVVDQTPQHRIPSPRPPQPNSP
jgi:hypothetical protein